MRLAWYAGASTALAGAVVVSAFHQRANFYSAMVHLSQSNISIMILVNLILLVYTSFMYGLQRLCYGPLRPVEIEQLYEKGWFAVTETCLAMTIFKEEVGGFFLVMFTALLTGKVWGWIGDGRVEVLEQQPPANPRLFHTRLSISLALSILYDCWLLTYAVRTVIQQARPNMMVMFLFEFAILLVSSMQTSLRYIVSLTEQRILKAQTRHGLEARRRQVREQRADILRRRESGEATAEENEEPLPDENDVEEMDIEVPGWEAKGHWILLLDLCADFVKLAIYGAFFMVLLTFYGLPLHIMRDLFMTTRSFVKRLGALLRYRQAIKDLNRYPDATAEDLARENTCIICREEMHPWDPNNATHIERTRPKKLPCGHILHFGCLKSWLERQQVCPTCRSSVVIGGPEAGRNNRDAVIIRVGGAPPNGNAADAAPAGAGAAQNNLQPQQPQPQQQRPNVRIFNLGPIRLGFAQGAPRDFPDMAQFLGAPPEAANNPTPIADAANPVQPGSTPGGGQSNVEAIYAQLRAIEERIQNETVSLRFAEQEAQVLRLLLQQIEFIRLGQAQNLAVQANGTHPGLNNHTQVPTPMQPAALFPPHTQNHLSAPGIAGLPPTQAAPQTTQPQFPGPSASILPPQHLNQILMQRLQATPSVTRHVATVDAAGIPSGSPDLPEGVAIPPGWTLLPLQRADIRAGQTPPPLAAESSGQAQARTQAQATTQPAGENQVPRPGSQDGASVSRRTPEVATNTAAPETTQSSSDSEGEDGSDDGDSGDETRISDQRQASQHSMVPGLTASAASASAMPAWGGSAQLFGGNSTPAGSSASPSQSSIGEPSVEGQDNQSGSTPKGKAKAVTVEEDSDEE